MKDFAIPSAQIRPILRNWKGPAGCIATDRILVDGCRVGYMYREMPDYEEDSGWRFLSGDESDDYLSDPQNSDVYDLNTICNYDTDIIPFLSYPAGSAFEAGPGRAFYPARTTEVLCVQSQSRREPVDKPGQNAYNKK